MGFFLVLKAELVRSLIIMRRYWFATVIGMLMGYGMLMALILGVMTNRQAVGEQMDQTLGSNATEFALGFIIGVFAFGIVGLFSQGLQGMARTGELEQVCMSPHGLVTNFMARSFVSAVNNIITSTILISLIAYSLKGGKLHFSAIPTITLLALTYINLIGFGFMIGGLVLVFKQTGQVAMLIRMGMLALGIFATEKINRLPWIAQVLAHALPITDAAICLKLVLIGNVEQPDGTILYPNGAGFQIFAHPSFYYMIINCVLWTFIGISCFKYLENRSRSKGTLGAY